MSKEFKKVAKKIKALEEWRKKGIILDPWQKEILDYKGNILLGKGRRIGATHIFGMKAVEHLVENYNHHPILLSYDSMYV